MGWQLGECEPLLLCDCLGSVLVTHYMGLLLGRAPTGTGTIALDPTLGSFTLLKPISH